MLSTLLVSNMSARLSSCLTTLLFFFYPIYAQTTLTIAAAADLAPLQPSLSAAFGKSHPAVTLRYVTESSAALAQQIENGASYDVFLSANAAFVERLAGESRLRPESVRVYAKGRLGLLWRDGKEHPIGELAGASVRFVAIANPKLAPYGAAALQVLEHAGLWQQLQSKVVYGENVRQALQLFSSGNADAVLTAASLLQGQKAQWINTSWHKPILQKGGVVASTRNLPAADSFMEFLTSPAGQAVFAQFGFAPVSSPGSLP